MRVTAILLAAALCAAAGSVAAQDDGSGQIFLPAASDLPEQPLSGAMFMLPRQWTLRFTSFGAVAEPPELDADVAIIELPAAADAAWAAYRPGAHHAVRLVTSVPAGDGWDEQESFEYETSPNEKSVIAAAALRNHSRWTVLIVEGATATFEKRAAAAGLITGSLQSPGYRPEIFAGRVAHPLETARIAAIHDFVEASMRRLDIPGAALALIDHGRIVYEGGIGVRALSGLTFVVSAQGRQASPDRPGSPARIPLHRDQRRLTALYRGRYQGGGRPDTKITYAS